MLGTIVNVMGVLAGGLLGGLIRKGIPEKYTSAIMKAIALCVLYIGFDNALTDANMLTTIFAMLLGALVGTVLDLDGKLASLGERLQARMKADDGRNFGQGFVTATLIFCVGAMAVVGPLQSGISGDHSTLFTKSVLDGITSFILATSLGVGVAFSAVSILIYQGTIALLAQTIAPLLGDTVVAQMTCVGGILIIGLGLNMLGVTKLKIMDYTPAIFFAALFAQFIR